MAKGDYYFPLFYKRLLTSTIGWKDDEFGAYVRLLIHQFDNGFVPKDLDELKRIAPSIKKHWALISKKFRADENGNLVNDVMKEVYEDVQKLKERNVKNGQKGGRPKKPSGLILGLPDETQTKPKPITNNQKPIMLEAIGSERTNQIANEAWGDQHWRQQLCVGLFIKNENDLKRWMAQFNSSIAQDSIPNFTVLSYKKMIRGWILKQQQKGVSIEQKESELSSNPNYKLKKIS